MKNQYLGDVNDYRKYGLLRALCAQGGPRPGVCWMLTADDGSTDGRKTRYLRQPEAWRRHDPALFDRLARDVVGGGARDVRWVERAGLLPGALFHADLLGDDTVARRGYFDAMLARLGPAGLIFFDPDNGLEVASVRPGRRGSCKYLYWDELVRTFEAGHSVLVYQHFPRVDRAAYIADRLVALGARTRTAVTMAFLTPHVVFLLAGQAGHRRALARGAHRVARAWAGRIAVVAGRA